MGFPQTLHQLAETYRQASSFLKEQIDTLTKLGKTADRTGFCDRLTDALRAQYEDNQGDLFYWIADCIDGIARNAELAYQDPSSFVETIATLPLINDRSRLVSKSYVHSEHDSAVKLTCLPEWIDTAIQSAREHSGIFDEEGGKAFFRCLTTIKDGSVKLINTRNTIRNALGLDSLPSGNSTKLPAFALK